MPTEHATAAETGPETDLETKPETGRCYQCRFWNARELARFGPCQRHAPVGAFPIVASLDGCGDWEPNRTVRNLFVEGLRLDIERSRELIDCIEEAAAALRRSAASNAHETGGEIIHLPILGRIS